MLGAGTNVVSTKWAFLLFFALLWGVFLLFPGNRPGFDKLTLSLPKGWPPVPNGSEM